MNGDACIAGDKGLRGESMNSAKYAMRLARFCLLPAAALVLSGCIRSVYNGQEFPALPEGAPVAIFRNNGRMPEGKYEILGYLRLSANEGTTESEFREKLIEEASSRGADAVRVDFFGPVLASQPHLKEISKADFEPSSFSGDLLPPAGGGDAVTDRYVIVLNAVLMADRTRFQEIMAERRAEREAAPPDPKDTGMNMVIWRVDSETADAEAGVSPDAEPVPGSGFSPEEEAVLEGEAE